MNTIQNPHFLFFAKYIESELGIVYSEQNAFQLQNRLEKIAKKLNLVDVDALYEMANKGISKEVKQLLLDSATNNETSFFRDYKTFDAIEALLSDAFRDPSTLSNKTFRVWSAGCATGQEPLSIAMIFDKLSSRLGNGMTLSLLATDISIQALTRAQTGVYSDLEIGRGLSPSFLEEYFQKCGEDQWAISPKLLKSLRFEELNLKSDFSFKEKFQLILCRNVLIYQKPTSKIEILTRVYHSLAPGGHLVLGAGESMIGLQLPFVQQTVKGAIVYTKSNESTKKYD